MHHEIVCLVSHLQHSPPTNWPGHIRSRSVTGLIDGISHAMCSQGVQGELKVICQGCAVSLVIPSSQDAPEKLSIKRSGAPHGPGPPVLLEWAPWHGKSWHPQCSYCSLVLVLVIFRRSGACIFWGQHSNENMRTIWPLTLLRWRWLSLNRPVKTQLNWAEW